VLEGSIPESIVAITNLEILDISRNEMGGGFPDGFTGLGSLRILDVSFNFFTGQIPDSIGDMTSLVEIRLNTNAAGAENNFGFSGPIPESIGFLDALVRFDAFENILTGTLPAAIGFLDNLQILDVGKNAGLGGTVPTDFQNLVTLREFYIGGTSITGEIPSGVCSDSLYLEISCVEEAPALSCNCCTCAEA
jgi:Leucine rich repeat